MSVTITGWSGGIGTDLALRRFRCGHEALAATHRVKGITHGIAVLIERKVFNQTLNVACGKGHSLERLADLVAGELSKVTSIRVAPAGFGEMTCFVAHTYRARRHVGYEPRISLPEEIRRTVAPTQASKPGARRVEVRE